jgi:molybdate transport system substrate-binding protein
VAAGEVEMIVAVVPSIVGAQGVELAGVFPAELQTYIGFAAAVSSNAREAEAAQAVIELLTSPKARALYKSRGMEAGAPERTGT